MDGEFSVAGPGGLPVRVGAGALGRPARMPTASLSTMAWDPAPVHRNGSGRAVARVAAVRVGGAVDAGGSA